MDDNRNMPDDPRYAAFAWRRFKHILWWMAGVAALASAVAVGTMWWALGWMGIHVAIATVLGTFCTIMMTAALMGLMFLSSGAGHDEQVIDPLGDEADRY
ncbi:hypothetical protein [Sphingomonas soli]|uniref:hypothetical protein n=1 Tax=Sphingomonas soli TaxID=266127 RepID=UPI000AF4AA79|nr:hypothetical protein [Sphingomonas soli]